ncbi:hypothetical protein pb186bvf_021048 [Paramecium bursaria]
MLENIFEKLVKEKLIPQYSDLFLSLLIQLIYATNETQKIVYKTPAIKDVNIVIKYTTVLLHQFSQPETRSAPIKNRFKLNELKQKIILKFHLLIKVSTINNVEGPNKQLQIYCNGAKKQQSSYQYKHQQYQASAQLQNPKISDAKYYLSKCCLFVAQFFFLLLYIYIVGFTFYSLSPTKIYLQIQHLLPAS